MDTPSGSGFHWEKDHLEAMIAENKSELSAVEEAAQRLRHKQYELKRLLNDTTSIISSLPREVISEIFLVICTEHQDQAFHALWHPIQFLIGRICKGWREIAWTTPRLWSNICIWFVKHRFDTQRRLLEEWIGRSGHAPLHLFIRVVRENGWQPPVGAFDALVDNSRRWETFDSHPIPNFASALDQPLQFPLLKTVQFVHFYDTSLLTLHKWNFDHAPLLHELQIIGLALLSERCLSINWKFLTRLSTIIGINTPTDADDFSVSLDVLASCQSLSYLYCDIRNNGSHVLDQTRCHLPCLEYMSCSGTQFEVVRFLGQTTVPALKSLSLDLTGGTSILEWMTAIVELTERSSFKLTKLEVDCQPQGGHCDDRAVDMMCQISRTNCIEDLSLGYHPLDQDGVFLDVVVVSVLIMGVDRGGTPESDHFPLLSRLHYSGNLSVKVGELSYMLESRMKHDTRKSLNEGSIAVHDNPHIGAKEEAEHAITTESNDLVAAQSQPIDLVASTGLSIYFEYENRTGFERQKPNNMRSFYKTVEAFSTEGRSFNLQYVGYESDSEGDEEDEA